VAAEGVRSGNGQLVDAERAAGSAELAGEAAQVGSFEVGVSELQI